MVPLLGSERNTSAPSMPSFFAVSARNSLHSSTRFTSYQFFYLNLTHHKRKIKNSANSFTEWQNQQLCTIPVPYVLSLREVTKTQLFNKAMLFIRRLFPRIMYESMTIQSVATVYITKTLYIKNKTEEISSCLKKITFGAYVRPDVSYSNPIPLKICSETKIYLKILSTRT